MTNSQVNLDFAGVQYAVDIDIESQYSDGDMSLSVSTSEGLYIVGGDTDITMSLHKGKINLPYTLVASELGRYYVYVNAQVQSGDEVSARSLTFIVQVGKEENKQEAQKAIEGPGTDYLIPMPAEEEIIH